MFDRLEERINKFMESNEGAKIFYQRYNRDQNSVFGLSTLTVSTCATGFTAFLTVSRQVLHFSRFYKF